MSIPLAVQYIVIALAVIVSAWVVLRKQFPHATRWLRIAIALPLVRETRAGWIRSLGRRIAPAGSASRENACGGCDSCGPSTP